MKLYMHPVSMTSRPVRLFIADNNIPVDEEVVDLFTGAHMQPPYSNINPNCLVPMLEDGDLKLTESSAILKYLADKIGSPAYPKDLKQRAKVNEMMDWINTNFYREWGYNLCYPQLFPHLKRRSDEAQAATLEFGKENAKRWLKILNDHWLGRQQALSMRGPGHHRRLFRRRHRDAGRGDRRRFLALSERAALARAHEEAAELGQDQRGVLRPGAVGEGPAVRHLGLIGRLRGRAARHERGNRMSFFPGKDPQAGDAYACEAIAQVIVPRTVDLGDFAVRRALPSARTRMVGPFIFFDHFGPAEFRAGNGLDVRPHPHIGLATVTYLFDGEIVHRDSLGTAAAIKPGEVNWMTAGRGIVHSERTGAELRDDRQPDPRPADVGGAAGGEGRNGRRLCPSRHGGISGGAGERQERARGGRLALWRVVAGAGGARDRCSATCI